MAAVSDALVLARVLRQQRDVAVAVGRAQARVASGLRVERSEDDPVAATWAQSWRDLERRLAAMGGAAEVARAEIEAQHGALEEMLEVFRQARTDAVACRISATLSASDVRQYQATLSGLEGELLGLANLNMSERYLFAGSLEAAAPFAATGAYLGNAVVRQLEVAEGDLLELNIPGSTLLPALPGGNGIAALGALAATLATLAAERQVGPTSPATFAQLGDAISAIDAASSVVREQLTYARARGQQLDRADARRGRRRELCAGRLEALVGSDIVADSTRLTVARDRFTAVHQSTSLLLTTLTRPQGR